jgi:1-acyl-sn-glycerol-3-phosphate acyltransferase
LNLIKNLSFGIYFISTVIYLNRYKKDLDAAQKSGDFEAERALIARATKDWSTMVFDHYGVTLEAEGVERVPEGPVLFVSNHQAYADVIALFAAIENKQTGFVAKEALAKVPFYGRWMVRIRCLMLDRGNARASAKLFQKGEEWLREGFSLMIYPEGTRSKSEHMGAFKKGSVRLATKTGVPIVPVTLSGTWRLFEEKGYPCGGTVKFYIHPPIETAGLPRTKQSELSDEVEAIIRAKLIEWNGED